MPRAHRPHPGITPALALTGALALALTGCSGVSDIADELTGGPTRDVVRPGAFAGGPGETVQRPEPEDVIEEAPADPAPPIANARIMHRPFTLSADPGVPGVRVASAVEAPVLVDAKVGDINGRPIFAREFFDPLEARLIAEAEELSRPLWTRFAAREIGRTLQTQVVDEVLEAEALADLTTEQRQGLRAFLDNVRNRIVSQNLGSERLADRRLREEDGRSLDEIIREEERTTLVRLEIMNKIRRRVNVSSRDIEQRYERDHAIYNPAPTAVFRLVRVWTEDADDVEKVRSDIASGIAFEDIAKSEINSFSPETEGVREEPVEGEYAEQDFWGADELNEAVWPLSPGQIAGPIVYGRGGSLTAWVKLEEIRRTSVSLYDAQLKIQQELQLERSQAELDRYIERLVDRARVDVEPLQEALLEIAIDWYAPAE